MKIVHMADELFPEKKKRIPLWKDEAYIRAMVRQFDRENNERLDRIEKQKSLNK